MLEPLDSSSSSETSERLVVFLSASIRSATRLLVVVGPASLGLPLHELFVPPTDDMAGLPDNPKIKKNEISRQRKMRGKRKNKTEKAKRSVVVVEENKKRER